MDKEQADEDLEAKNLSPWDPVHALESLTDERRAGLDEDEYALARRLLRENAPNAVLAIVHLAQNSSNEATRLKAAQYVVDRVMGRVTEGGLLDEANDPFTRFLAQCVSEVGENG